MTIRGLTRMRTLDGSPQYLTRNGWVIRRFKRDYSERGGERGYQRAPMYHWSAAPVSTRPRDRFPYQGGFFDGATLTEVADWCSHNEPPQRRAS